MERSRRPGCPEAPRGTLPPGSHRYLCAAATPRSLSRGRGRLPPRPAAPIGAVLTDWEVNLTDSFWNWEKGGLVLETLQGRTFLTGGYAALSVRFFNHWCLRFQLQRIPGTPLPPPVTYLCKRSSLRHGADVGSFLLPCVGGGREEDLGCGSPWGMGGGRPESLRLPLLRVIARSLYTSGGRGLI